MRTTKQQVDLVGNIIETLQAVRKRQGQLREVARCAAGVMRTADPQRIKDAVVADWWRALEQALGAAQLGDVTSHEDPAMTRDRLAQLLPNAHLELVDGELVIWTGWAVNPKDPAGPLADWDPDVHGDRVR